MNHTVANRTTQAGFSLVEILIALSLLGLITVMLFTSFYSVNRAWTTGREVIDATGHSDYLLEQLSAALRSAYTPGSGEKYGFVFTDDGEGKSARDIIEWTKIGPALIGENAEFSNVPHRIRAYLSEPNGEKSPGGFTVRSWRQDLQLEAFNPEEDTAELCLSPKVIAFNCRMLDPDQPRTSDGELNWIDDWAKTNTLPIAVELTFWMAPPLKDEEPIESKRIVELPMGALSQNPSLGSSANDEARRGTSTTVGGKGHGTQFDDSSDGIFRPGQNPGKNPGNSTGGSGNIRPPSHTNNAPPPKP